MTALSYASSGILKIVGLLLWLLFIPSESIAIGDAVWYELFVVSSVQLLIHSFIPSSSHPSAEGYIMDNYCLYINLDAQVKKFVVWTDRFRSCTNNNTVFVFGRAKHAFSTPTTLL
jgi:hypothetical protein